MGRPRKDSPSPSAQQLMTAAFWALLEQKPYERITVNDIAAHAHVNRNTFYYHYDCLDDLANACIMDVMPTEAVGGAITAALAGGSFALPEKSVLFDGSNKAFRRLQLIAGPHSSRALVETLQTLIEDFWLEQVGVQRETLNSEEAAVVSFCSGGLVAVFSRSPAITLDELYRYMQSRFMRDTAERALDILRKAQV